jgi:alkanesulfonate monooxygenase SsuD/methylene tetrahydromethanopterin reductase-like flavin-dependent oxidoreductase (luciferase family)
MPAFSVLDLAPVPQGKTPGDALRNTLDLAQHAERWGYRRYWLAEHHNMVGIASAATAVVIGYIAAGTGTIRVGAGGIMLPNHSPLVIAEQFGTLESLYRLLGPLQPGQVVQAVPGTGLNVPLWILGSSLFGAQLAAMLGLPYAFASHFAPAALHEALRVYRARFQPSQQLERPYAMVGANVIAAETGEEARRLFTSVQQQFANRFRGARGQLPPPVDDIETYWSAAEREQASAMLACSFVGSPDTVARGLGRFAEETGADEIMVACAIYDHSARLRSYEILASIQSIVASSTSCMTSASPRPEGKE